MEIGVARHFQPFRVRRSDGVDAPREDGIELRSLHIVDALPGLCRRNHLPSVDHPTGNLRDAGEQAAPCRGGCIALRLLHLDEGARDRLQGGNGRGGIVRHLVSLTTGTGEKHQLAVGIQGVPTATGSQVAVVLVIERQCTLHQGNSG